VDRHPGETDFRIEAMKNALPILVSGKTDRTKEILEALSDPTTVPIPKAVTQGATGAWKGETLNTGA
jgi:hypothetical protein